jgi:hypothetical protein
MRFDLAADIFIDPDPGAPDHSDLHAELELTPADWLDWWFYLRVDPSDGHVREFNTRVMIVDRGDWSVGIGSDFLQNNIDQYQILGRYALSEVNEIYGSVRYDARADRFNEITAGVQTRLAQNWNLRTGVSFRDGPRRESGFSFKIDLRFVAF